MPIDSVRVAHLFDPLTIRDLQFANRVVVSPMCEYSSGDGLPNDWHLVHLGSRAVGGAGLVMTEATAGPARGPHQSARPWHLERCSCRAVAAYRSFHSRRKAASPECNWRTPAAKRARPRRGKATAPFRRATAAGKRSWHRVPLRSAKLSKAAGAHARWHSGNRRRVCRRGASRLRCGLRVIEIHAAHGYLIHEFFSPLSNQRDDDYGGSFENRTRVLREIVTPCAAPGRKARRCSCAFRRPTGSKAAGTSNNRSRSHAS